MKRWLALLLLTCARSASADPDAGSLEHGVGAARAHFQRGVVLYRSGAYDAALAEFSRAYEAAPNYRILYNLAQLQAQRHDYVEARALFLRYLSAGGSDVSAERAETLRAEIAELGQRISRLHVDSNVDAGQLFIGELPALELPLKEAVLLNAGIYRLRLEKPGYVTATRTLTLVGGEAVSISLELAAELDMDELARPPPLPVAPPPRPAPDRSALWASLVTTGALAGATVTFGVLTQRANAQLDERSSRPAPSPALLAAGRERVRTFALLTDLFGLAAAGAAGLSAYLLLSEPDEPDPPSTSALGALLTPDAAGVSWMRSF